MIKNNIKALFFQVITSSAIIAINKVGYLETIDDISNFPVMALSLLLLPVYILFGFLLLKDMKTNKKNFLSTISIVILGIIVWLICLNSTDYNHLYEAYGDDGYVYEWWTYHDSIWQYYYNGLLPFFTLTFPIQILGLAISKGEMLKDAINLCLTFLPSLCMLFGISLRNKMNRIYKKGL